MAEFARTIVSRLRRYVRDRRYHKRHYVRLEVNLSLDSATKGLNGRQRISSLVGHTRDLSADGLSLIVPQITLDKHHLVGENRSLNLKLHLPGGRVEMQAAPVRYERLEEAQGATGYLIAVKIVSMAAEDRAKFASYVAALQGRELEPV